MRKELKEIDYYVYGLSESDFEYFRDLIGRVSETYLLETMRKLEPLRDDPEAVEVVSDVAYYAHVDRTFLWEYALWRFQGMLEGLITTVFVPSLKRERVPGIAAKLLRLRAAGYTLSALDENELLEWARLRNALSHSPPEQYRPVWIEEQDVDEYLTLVLRLCRQWRTEIGGSARGQSTCP